MPGTVYLVGAGPGDPGLLTCRGRELLESSDCILHDYLVNPLILDLAPASAARHDVGKRGGAGSTTQELIQRELVRLAGIHQRIVRLKGGDPFLFGRGGEEAACLAEAGHPLRDRARGHQRHGRAGVRRHPETTHRAASSAVAFVTGHRQAGDPEPLEWASFARIETLVLYMGMHRLAENCAALIAHGRDASTPACAIQWGTYPRQRVVEGTLATLPALVAAAGLGAPAITVVGEVVRFRQRIRWFDHPLARPLFGRRILVTRARDQASALASGLRSRGAEVIEAPVTRFAPVPDPAGIDRALSRLSRHAWIAFTSANGVRFLGARLHESGLDARAFAGVRIAAVGPATADALLGQGLRADLVAQERSAAGLARELARTQVPSTILLPQADNARSLLGDELRGLGWSVETLVTYRALELPLPESWHGDGQLDAVTFASSGTVERFIASAGAACCSALALEGCRFYAIGPQTAATMLQHGMQVAAQASEAVDPRPHRRGRARSGPAGRQRYPRVLEQPDR